ncbi:hypothetical protein QF026_000059 [Streptomyces aurantiacus]|uniref:hypothetical protein n=1 Tax=Streptomyces aurantiacus TaxID=47760 RepID=UPI00278D97F3|nr:hypothetical protein [Streptomyces aurantiacus]MDQ0771593.1 hypothetical protein [Streptomyces aurantiacus]
MGVYQASKELGGGVAQVQKTASKAQQLISREFLTQLSPPGARYPAQVAESFDEIGVCHRRNAGRHVR